MTGIQQIQNFDAFTGQACGTGPIRALTSQFVVNQAKCDPVSYTSMQVISPARGTYTSGTVDFADGDGNPLPGVVQQTLDNTGTANLTGLNLNNNIGLPQFLITLNGGSGASSVTVKLTWNATFDPSCVGPTTTVVVPGTPAATPPATPAGPTAPTVKPTPKTLSRRTQKSLKGKVVWASTSNPFYSLGGVRPGQSLKSASKKLGGTEKPFHIGHNDWYLARKGAFTAVLKVRHGEVQEIGIANNALTATRQTQSVLMHSFF